MKKARKILITLIATAILVIIIAPEAELGNDVVFAAGVTLSSGITALVMCMTGDKENGAEAGTTRRGNINRQAGFSEDNIMQELQEQMRMQDDEMLRYHMSVAEATRIECEEAEKVATPFSLGGYDLAHDIAEDQNQSFINDSFGGFGDMGSFDF